jgi:hypothetical protein
MADLYRLSNVLKMNPLFISLGLPNSAFKSFNPAIPATFFDAAVNCGPLHPDCIWLFKGSDYHRYNLRARHFEVENSRISQFAKSGTPPLPPAFRSGVDTVVYAGSAFPLLYYFFTEETFIRLNSAVAAADTPEDPAEGHWNADEGPRGVLGAWAVGVWTNPNGSFKRPGPMAGLHGEGSRFVGCVHFFRENEYVLHDLRTGGTAAGPMPIGERWKLPEPFTERIDLAFYGAGPESQKIYFISGQEFALYDPEIEIVLRKGKTEREFPGFAAYLTRPQIFLVEDMSVRTYLGPLQDGNLIDTRSIGPGEALKRVLVIETVNTSASEHKSSILDQQDSSTVKNLNENVTKQTNQTQGSESYRYHLDAAAHGDASATGFWGGEVNATLSAQGGSDSVRDGFAENVFNGVTEQVTESKQQIVAKTVSSTDQITSMEKVLNIMEFEQRNRTDRIMNVGFFQILQSFFGLMVLNSVRVAFSDGFNPDVRNLSELEDLLEAHVSDEEVKQRTIQFVKGELSGIKNSQNERKSLLVESGIALNSGVSDTAVLVAPNGETQKIAVPGIIKSARDWINPTRSIIGRDL